MIHIFHLVPTSTLCDQWFGYSKGWKNQTHLEHARNLIRLQFLRNLRYILEPTHSPKSEPWLLSTNIGCTLPGDTGREGNAKMLYFTYLRRDKEIPVEMWNWRTVTRSNDEIFLTLSTQFLGFETLSLLLRQSNLSMACRCHDHMSGGITNFSCKTGPIFVLDFWVAKVHLSSACVFVFFVRVVRVQAYASENGSLQKNARLFAHSFLSLHHPRKFKRQYRPFLTSKGDAVEN